MSNVQLVRKADLLVYLFSLVNLFTKKTYTVWYSVPYKYNNLL